MSQAEPAPQKRRSVRGYAFALAGVVVLGALYFWANTGPKDGPGDQRARTGEPAPQSSAAVPGH